MADLGLLLQDDLALAAFEGRKTVTRRPLAAQPPREFHGHHAFALVNGKRDRWAFGNVDGQAWPPDPEPGLLATIRGAGTAEVGGRVWVRECWRPEMGGWKSWVKYRAGGRTLNVPDANVLFPKLKKFAMRFPGARREKHSEAWHPSVHMPKWASRTWGRITSMTPCDLSTIDDAEAKREGFETAGELKAALRSLYPDCVWYWRIAWTPIPTPNGGAQ